MSDQQQTREVHPAALGGSLIAGAALVMAVAGFDMAWMAGLIAVGVSAATQVTGGRPVATRLLGLVGILGGLAAVVIQFA